MRQRELHAQIPVTVLMQLMHDAHRQHSVGARRLEEIGHELGRDRLARTRLLVLTNVEVPGDHGRDPLRRSELRGVDHDQELHQVRVHGDGSGLDDEDVERMQADRRVEERAVRVFAPAELQLGAVRKAIEGSKVGLLLALGDRRGTGDRKVVIGGRAGSLPAP